jgi:hypothetical protein
LAIGNTDRIPTLAGVSLPFLTQQTRNTHRHHNRLGHCLRSRFDLQNHPLDGHSRRRNLDQYLSDPVYGDSHFGSRHFLFLPPLGAFIMQIQNRYINAVNTVLDWDIPEDSYPEAVNAQACHLANFEDSWSDDVWRYDLGRSVH